MSSTNQYTGVFYQPNIIRRYLDNSLSCVSTIYAILSSVEQWNAYCSVHWIGILNNTKGVEITNWIILGSINHATTPHQSQVTCT